MKYLFEISGCLKIKEIEDYENEVNASLREMGMKESVHFSGPISTITVSSNQKLPPKDLDVIKEKIEETYKPHVKYLKVTYKEI